MEGRKGQRLRSTFTEEEALDFEETEVVWGRVLEGRDLGSSMSMPSPTRAPTTKQPTTRPPTRPPTTSGGGGTLLAIGDSLCTGHLPEPKNTIFFSDEGYVDTLYEYLQDEYDFDDLLKVCCSDEDSFELIDASYSVPPSDGSNCYDNPETPPSQLDAAVTALQSGTVRLMTISIGANDLLPCVFAPGDPQACAATQIEALLVNLLTILTTLSDAMENMPPIVAMTPYNPILSFFLSEDENEQALVPISQQAILGLQTEVAKVYTQFGVPTVFSHFVFDGLNETLVDGDVPQNVASICRYTGMCDETHSGFLLKSEELRDIHANPEGYEKLGIAHFEVVDELL